MANNLSPVPPFNATNQYFNSKTPSGLSTAGYQWFAQLQAAQGVAPTVSGAPTATNASPGAFAFDSDANMLHVYNGTKWVSVQLA